MRFDGTCDTHARLISEVRTGEDRYNFACEYDQGGNRIKKIQSLAGCDRIETVYHYDYENPVSNGSYNNRLMYYETYETCRVFEDYGHTGGCGTGGEEPLSTTWYYYNDAGNVTHVVKQNAPPEEPAYEATRLEYGRNGRAVTYVLGETWDEGRANYNITYAREFRYDSARQRYLDRRLDPAELLATGDRVALSDTWSDYDGDEIYGDFEVDDQTITELRSFELGIANFAWDVGVPDPTTVDYYHTDRAGTTRFMTDSTGTQVNSSVYTAFGERISGTQHRYGYAGAWGYEASSSDDPQDPYVDLGLLHLNPYYDPDTGRSLQRNARGIAGGLNVYTNAKVLCSKGGKQYKRPSDLPPNWDKMSTKEQQEWLKDAIDKARSKKHKDSLRAWKKKWKRRKIKESSRPPWWARFGRRIPAPAPQNVRKWQRRFLIGGLAFGCGAAGLAAGGAGAGAGVLVPAL